MALVIHRPADEKGREALAKKVASVHAQAVVERVKAMSCSPEQKVKLMEAVRTCPPCPPEA